MDDDKFKREVLAKLDKIASLLSISCAIANGSLEKSRAEMALRQVMANNKAGENRDSQYLLRDEMQDDYNQAMEKWKSERQA